MSDVIKQESQIGNRLQMYLNWRRMDYMLLKDPFYIFDHKFM